MRKEIPLEGSSANVHRVLIGSSLLGGYSLMTHDRREHQSCFHKPAFRHCCFKHAKPLSLSFIVCVPVFKATAMTSEEHEDPATATAEAVRPGVVVIRGICSREEEKYALVKLLEKGEHPTEGFYEIAEDGTRRYNSTISRGRIYRELSFYGEELSRWILNNCEKAISLSRQVDSTIPHMVPDHALLLYYSSNVGIREHMDNGKNDGEGDAPIVSFNFGKSVEYLVRMSKDEAKMSVPLGSGDVILFGGPARILYHSVKICKKQPSPYPDILKDRVNLTLRYAPDILGREEEFRSFKPGDLFWKKKSAKIPNNSAAEGNQVGRHADKNKKNRVRDLDTGRDKRTKH